MVVNIVHVDIQLVHEKYTILYMEEKVLTADEKFALFMKGDDDLKFTPEEANEIFSEERIRSIFEGINVIFTDVVPPEESRLVGMALPLPNYEIYACGTDDDFYFTAVKKPLTITEKDILIIRKESKRLEIEN